MVKENEAKTPDKHSALSFRHFILGAIAIFLYVGVEVGIPNFMNLFATSSEIGIDPTVAGSIVRYILVLDDDRTSVRLLSFGPRSLVRRCCHQPPR